jgi:hypothetical protein
VLYFWLCLWYLRPWGGQAGIPKSAPLIQSI